MKCIKCRKLIKEDTAGNPKYCQGHSIFDRNDTYHEKINGNGSCPFCGGHTDSCRGCNGTGYNISD